MTIGEVATVTHGRLVDGAITDSVVDGPVVIDSRRCAPGTLFVCVRGERLDGHDFAPAAVEAGAVAAVVDHAVGVPAVLVADPGAALADLARHVLGRAPRCQVVGITGSSGKTSTKDLLAQLFERGGPTVAPEGSFNNELGLPLTVLRVDESTRSLVLEYSARGVGHIRYLCGIARPNIAIVLNVGDAHLGEFGSREAIAQAKGELVEALDDDGVAVLNADDPLVAAMRTRTAARIVTFGCSADADVRFSDVDVDDLARPRFTLHTQQGTTEVALRLHGAHQVSNAAGAAAAALTAGLPFADVVDALRAAEPRSGHRMQLRRRPDGLVVVDDAYNANPASVTAALEALVRLGRAGRARTWAVLGEMRELGPTSVQLHESVGVDAARFGVDELVAVAAAAPVAVAAKGVAAWSGRARTVDDVDAAVRLLRREVRAEDVVLVKASNSIELWRVADALLRDVPAGATA